MVVRGMICALALTIAPGALAKNLWLIDEDPESGFALYRSGVPDEADVRRLCELGIEEMVVLSGNGAEHEARHRRACPELRVVYDHRQDVDCALTATFLADFDRWVDEAREEGRKIAFRCNCGCHRTGRLAAYYQMKHRGASIDEALALMNERGKRMWWYRSRLGPQVAALRSYIDGQGCELEGRRRRFCVVEEPGPGKCARAQKDVGISRADPPLGR